MSSERQARPAIGGAVGRRPTLERALGGTLLLIAAGAAYLLLWQPVTPSSLSLIDEYPDTIKRSVLSPEEAFSVYDATLLGETRRVVYARPPGRITWKVTPPRGAQLTAWLALREEAWSRAGDGVIFRIGVSDGRQYDELLNRRVDPYRVQEDRRWVPVTIDLSAYELKTVDIIFNTDPNLATEPANGSGDLALWGEPIVTAVR